MPTHGALVCDRFEIQKIGLQFPRRDRAKAYKLISRPKHVYRKQENAKLRCLCAGNVIAITSTILELEIHFHFERLQIYLLWKIRREEILFFHVVITSKPEEVSLHFLRFLNASQKANLIKCVFQQAF